MVQIGISPEELRIKDGEFPADEAMLETPWTFWYDKKTADRKESDQYMEGLRQLGSFGTIEGFYRHYTYLLRPNEFPRDHNLLMFRKGYKPMWEEFPEGGCWIVRIKRKQAQSHVNRMWENLLIACIGEAFELPDVVGCVLSTRVKDDVLSVWNLTNQNNDARFRIGEKLKEILDLDMNALIQYKDHMQSLHDYSTYRNARNYMFAPSISVTPLMGTLETPMQTFHGPPGTDVDFEGMLPPAAIDDMLPPAAIDTESPWQPGMSSSSPEMRASAPPFAPTAGKSPQMSATTPPFVPAVSSEAAAAEGTQPAPAGGKSWAAIAAAAAGGTSPTKGLAAAGAAAAAAASPKKQQGKA